jgi:hypothetical protein
MKVIDQLKRFAGIFLIIILLAIAICIYFFKYVPEQRNVFHRSAFLELSQIERAFQERTLAYRAAIMNYLKVVQNQNQIFENTPLDSFFTIKGAIKKAKPQDYRDSILEIGAPTFDQDSMTKVWELAYPMFLNHKPIGITYTKNLDTLLSKIVFTYKDIFENYLLIRDNLHLSTKKSSATEESNAGHKPPTGEIIFNPGNIVLDYEINTDSLLKKIDGLSLINVRDVSVEGNPYKLFLYPFKLGNERVILAGLINAKDYNKAYQKIPFSLISLAGVLVLLLLIHLPIIRIYLLGSFERIRDIDIRFIIGSYFIAAFVGFFLFTKIFLDQEQAGENKDHLRTLSKQISSALVEEITNITVQLQSFDDKLDSLIKKRSPLLSSMCSKGKDVNFERNSIPLENIFKPEIYPYPDNLYWIDSKGDWVARWGFKKVFDNAPLIHVADRDYYTQFQKKENLMLRDGPLDSTAFTIQPTLSKLDGEYTISVLIPSNIKSKLRFIEKNRIDSAPNPWLLGMSSQMNSVHRVILPGGYSFSIVNNKGEILYDSKPGRALLANITKETDMPMDILQSIRYRNERYFGDFTLKGKQIALLTTPMQGFPYELLVYHNLSNNDTFQEHLIGLSGMVTGGIIVLLIFLALVNEWSRKKSLTLQTVENNFEWIYPAYLKQRYYDHLILWMGILFLVYVMTWVFIENFLPQSEFLLLFTCILFPFFIAIHYYLLREKYFVLVLHMEPPPGLKHYIFSNLQLLLLLIILLVNCFAFVGGFSWEKCLPLLIFQIIFLAAISISVTGFKNKPVKKPDAKESKVDDPILRRYSLAIIIGIFLVSIIPAAGVFWLIFRQECSLESNSELLGMAIDIQERRSELNERLGQYKFKEHDPTDSNNLQALKYKYGIYSLLDECVHPDNLASARPLDRIAPEYTHLHRLFFSQDSVILAWTNPPNSASDGSWRFVESNYQPLVPQLIYNNQRDSINPGLIRLTSNSNSSWGASRLMGEKFKFTGPLSMILYLGGILLSILLAYRMTLSLAKRIFLVKLFQSKDWLPLLHNSDVNITLRDPNESWFDELNDLLRPVGILPANFTVSLQDVNCYECDRDISKHEEKILEMGKLLKPYYEKIWEDLSSREKFILFDFAIDGFANYKNEKILRKLLEKGILYFEDRRLALVTSSLREFILDQQGDEGINTFMKKAETEDSWRQLKIPLLLILSGIGIFVFVTQDEVYQKITGLFATITSLLPLINSLFKKPMDGQTEKPDA